MVKLNKHKQKILINCNVIKNKGTLYNTAYNLIICKYLVIPLDNDTGHAFTRN